MSQNGRTIQVPIATDEGPRFRIYLSRVDGETDTKRRVRRTLPPTKGSETILIVEDSDVICHLAREVLHMNRYRALDARSGKKAIQAAGDCASPIHLLLPDVALPEMRGFEPAAALLPSPSEMKVLFMSGEAKGGVSGGIESAG